MGYYQIVTSETDMEPEEVIEAYHELTRIEDQFREMKGTLETRPMFVRTRAHMHDGSDGDAGDTAEAGG